MERAGKVTRLSWKDDADDEEYYVIERKEKRPAIWHIVATLPPDTTHWTDSEPSHIVGYKYRLRAWKNGGESHYSAYTEAIGL